MAQPSGQHDRSAGASGTSRLFHAVATALALIALIPATYLAIQSLTGGQIAGCGTEQGCGAVLASPWARVGPVPVSILAVIVYFAVLAALGLRRGSQGRSRFGDALLLAAIPALLGAAGWFTYVQRVELDAWCPYCLSGHAVGVALALTIAAGLIRRCAVRPAGPLLLGMVGVGSLIAVQTLWPAPPATGVVDNPHLDRDDDQIINGRRYLSMFGGEAQFYLDEQPYLGDGDAPQVVGLVFDYACPHCREMHGFITDLMQSRGGFAVAALPVSLSPEHNRYYDDPSPRFNGSYDLATISLAVWSADPSVWPAFDRWLFSPDDEDAFPRTTAQARAMAGELLGEQALAEQLSGEPLARQHAAVDRNIGLFALIPAEERAVPITTVPGAANHRTGELRDPEAIDALLQEAASGLLQSQQ